MSKRLPSPSRLALLETLPRPAASPSRSRHVDRLGASLLHERLRGSRSWRDVHLRSAAVVNLSKIPNGFSRVAWTVELFYVRAELQTTYPGRAAPVLAQQVQDPVSSVAARVCLRSDITPLGAVAAALTHYATGYALYDSQQHHAAAFLYGGDAVWWYHSMRLGVVVLGYPDRDCAEPASGDAGAAERTPL